MNEGRVIISVEDYRQLVAKATKYDILLEACFDDAELDWSKTGLRCGNDSFYHVVKVVAPDEYENAYLALKPREEEEDAEV